MHRVSRSVSAFALLNTLCSKVANILGDGATVQACRCSTANPSSGGEVGFLDFQVFNI